jgi:hypothetical protein
MPLYIEYDKTDGSIKRLLTAESLPVNIAYLAYQEIPEGVNLDMSLKINDIINIIVQNKNNEEKDINKTLNNNNEEPEIIEV